MIAAILCPGPSLAGVAAWPPCDVSLAVNWAMDHPLAAQVIFWVALDLWTCRLPKYAPQLAMVTSAAALNEGQRALVPYPMVDFRVVRKSRPTATSLPAAIYWAAGLGCKTVELLGCDMTNQLDFRGIDDGSDRSPARWNLEREACLYAARRMQIELKGLP